MTDSIRLVVICLAFWILCQAVDGKVQGKAIIIDTDIFGDVDDVGALAIANLLQNCGLADIRGVAINTHSKYGALAASAINTYYGNNDIPIATLRPLSNDIWTDTDFFNRGDFASKIGMTFPKALKDAEDTKTPIQLYREVLEAAEDDSLTIVSIGFLNNLASLLETPKTSALLGSKIHELVIMGGNYPGGWEYNFGHQDPACTARVLHDWPTNIPITYVGFELGIDILSGQGMRNASPPESPVLAAYEYYVGRCSTVRESWDPVTMLYAILGLDGFDKIGLQSPLVYANEHGYNSIVDATGTNTWVNDSTVTNQHWLTLKDGVSNTTMSAILNKLYVQDTNTHSCDMASKMHEEL